MGHQDYEEPVNRLLTLGDPDGPGATGRSRKWADYSALGIGEADVPELIRMACDARPFQEPNPCWWGPVHAWRALGQLKAQAATEPLVEYLNRLSKWNHDWGLEEIPDVLEMIGPSAVPALARAIVDQRNEIWARAAGCTALKKIALAYPETRANIISVLADQVGRARYNDPTLNGIFISPLIRLNATEAAEQIRHAYEIGMVDEQTVGSLNEVLEEIKLTPEQRRARARERYGDDLIDAPAEEGT